MTQTGCRVSKHGARQIEISVLYGFQERESSRYELDAYFFVPYHLAPEAGSYTPRSFYHDMKSYVRLQPTALGFAQLCSPQCEASPLKRIKDIIRNTEIGRQLDAQTVIYELRMLVNLHHEEFGKLRRILQPMFAAPGTHEQLVGRILDILHEHDRFLEELRGCRGLFADTRVPEDARLALAWADEAISIKTGRECHKLRLLAQEQAGFLAVRQRLIEKCGHEQNYRRAQGYNALIRPEAPVSGETFLHRESTLKKWAQSATYMSVLRSKIGSHIGHLLAGIAAAAAMLFAVAAMFLAERLFASFTLPWAILIVVSYIFKDRIKEVFRGVLMQWLPRLVADERVRLIDPSTGASAGQTRSRVRFLQPAGLPEETRRLWQRNRTTFWRMLPPDFVIHFHNTIDIANRALLKSHLRLEGVNSIMRLRLDTLREQMDDPVNTVHFIEDGQPASLEAKRVYHLYLIISLTQRGEPDNAQLHQVRVVMNRDGIVRIEPLAQEQVG